jgi:hypothetical protein
VREHGLAGRPEQDYAADAVGFCVRFHSGRLPDGGALKRARYQVGRSPFVRRQLFEKKCPQSTAARPAEASDWASARRVDLVRLPSRLLRPFSRRL